MLFALIAMLLDIVKGSYKMIHYIETPLTKEKVKKLKIGDRVYISGTIYTARDAAHKRLCELANSEKQLPFDITDSIIYYVGPTPAKPDKKLGSAGPTTAYRMDAYSPTMIELGQRGMIGKGLRSPEVINSMKKHKAVYFVAIGGAGAMLSHCVTSSKIIAYEDLGAEAIRKLTVENLPVIVAIDSFGNNLYEKGKKNYLESITQS